MEENPRYVVGVDIGTETMRGVMATVTKDAVSVVGYGEVPNNGMRKGEIANLSGPAKELDQLLYVMEKMSGLEVKGATLSVNGVSIQSMKIDGMIAMGGNDHVVTGADLDRIEEAALMGRAINNRDLLKIVPFEYVLDGQGGIKDPYGMTGARLEMKANLVTALSSVSGNVRKMAEMVDLGVSQIVPAALAAGNAVLTEKQMEHGVAVVDFGATTTGVAVYDEGDLQCIFVIPAGSEQITKDLAKVLEVNMDVAEEVKKKFVTGFELEEDGEVTVKRDREEYKFDKRMIDEHAKARLVDIFERVENGLMAAGYHLKLPEGVVIVGGGAKMKGLDVFVKNILHTAVKIGAPKGLSGVAESVMKPEYATAVGLMLMEMESGAIGMNAGVSNDKKNKSAKSDSTKKGFLQFLNKF